MTSKMRGILCWSATGALAAIFILFLGISSGQRRMTACSGLEVTVKDSSTISFITPADVKAYLADYGDYIGQRMDSVDLRKIEEILDGRSAILKSEAYMTADGVLNVDITQREPAVRFQKGSLGFYSDKYGFIFPMRSGYLGNIPIIDGNVRIDFKDGYKGYPEDEAEQRWLKGILDLVAYMKGNPNLNALVTQITVSPGGDLVMVPREGPERFIFGEPTAIADKFHRIKEYYECIVPTLEDKRYKSVNVKYDGQIICRKN